MLCWHSLGITKSPRAAGPGAFGDPLRSKQSPHQIVLYLKPLPAAHRGLFITSFHLIHSKEFEMNENANLILTENIVYLDINMRFVLANLA